MGNSAHKAECSAHSENLPGVPDYYTRAGPLPPAGFANYDDDF
jgi:hypothetical protein